MRLVVGTYTRGGSFGGEGDGVYLVDLSPKAPSEPLGVFVCEDPTHVAAGRRGGLLYAACHANRFDGEPGAGVIALRRDDLAPVARARVPHPHATFAVVSRSGASLLVACSFGGAIGALRLGGDGTIGEWTAELRLPGAVSVPLGAHPRLQPVPGSSWMRTPALPTPGVSAHPHCLVEAPSSALAFAADLAQGTVTSLAFNESSGTLQVLHETRPAGADAGPRVLVCHPTWPVVYCLNEWGGTLSTLTYDGEGRFGPATTVPTAPGASSAAGLALTSDGRTLLTTDRSTDALCVFDVETPSGRPIPRAVVPTGGERPQHVSVAPDDRTLYVCNATSGTITAFARDTAGDITPIGTIAHIPTPACSLVIDDRTAP